MQLNVFPALTQTLQIGSFHAYAVHPGIHSWQAREPFAGWICWHPNQPCQLEHLHQYPATLVPWRPASPSGKYSCLNPKLVHLHHSTQVHLYPCIQTRLASLCFAGTIVTKYTNTLEPHHPDITTHWHSYPSTVYSILLVVHLVFQIYIFNSEIVDLISSFNQNELGQTGACSDSES